MSTHNFKVHDTTQSNIYNDSEYNSLAQRVSGYQSSNLIKSKDFNTFMREASLQAVAISDLLIDSDDGSAATLGIGSATSDVKDAYQRGFNNLVETHLGNSQVISGINGDISDIETRLTNLGFKEGSFTVNTLASITTTTNNIKKQGKYVIANLDITVEPNQGTQTITLNVPSDFLPKQNTSVALLAKNDYTNITFLYNNSAVTITTSGQITFTDNNNGLEYKIINAAWEIN